MRSFAARDSTKREGETLTSPPRSNRARKHRQAHARSHRQLDGGIVFCAISRLQTEARGARGVKTIWTMLQEEDDVSSSRTPNHRKVDGGCTEKTQIVYAPPKLADVEFSALVTNITEEARGKRPLIIAGDFNAWSTEWGCQATRQRATTLLDALAPLEAVLLNTGNTPTFTGALGYSVVDLTFASDTLASQVTSWAVSELYMHSDHQAIVFEIEIAGPPRPATRQSCKWNARSLDTGCLTDMMASATVPPEPTEEMATRLMADITSACDASMTKVGGRRRRGAVYWWTSEIANLWRSCLRARRLAQRARGRPNADACRASCTSARRLLRAAIKSSKRLCWNKLCDEVNEDVWGKPYEAVMSRLRGPRANSPSSPTL
ncbi:unnamed protein product, partial [Trichogramma brassicae]